MEELKLVELLLTAEIYNRFTELTEDDIPKEIRKLLYNKGGINRPVVIKYDVATKYVGGRVEGIIRSIPFVDYNSFTKQIKLTSFEIAAKWFAQRGV